MILVAACAVFGVAFAAFYRLVLFHFYVRGSFLLDTGLLASLIHHNSPAMMLPPSLGGESFFAFHVAPLLIAVNAASYFLPLSMPQLFAAFVGVCHGLLGLGAFWLLVDGYGLRRGWGLALATLVGGAFAFNGLALDIARYPHFETFAAACLVLCFVALVLERALLAALWLALAVATREDVGLHAFGFLFVWIALNQWRGVAWRRSAVLAGFALAGLAASVVALALQHRAFPLASSFVRVYLGDPAFTHLNAEFIATHVFGWIALHAPIYLPAIATAIWALRARNPYISAGYIACVPWLVLHLLAVSDQAGWMVEYYAYPFLIAMIWPWLAMLMAASKPPNGVPAAIGLLAMIALSLLPLGRHYDPTRITLPDAFLYPPSSAQQATTDAAIARIAASRPALGRLVVDHSIAALLPMAFVRAEVAGWQDGPPNTAVFLAEGYDSDRLRALPGLPRRYRIDGTEIWVATDRPDGVMRELGFVE